jgi:hypothetical protein
MLRREVLGTSAATLLIATLARTPAWAGGTPAALDAWARALVGANEALRDRVIGVGEWQRQVEALNGNVDVAALTRYLDIDALTRAFAYRSRLADTADPVLPPEIAGDRRQWFIRVFGMRQGGVVIPHVHNNMVSAHLVISGVFHTRTADRVRDVENAVVMRQTRHEDVGVGGVVSMSDVRDNHHWLLARQDRSMTLDVGVTGLAANWEYGHEANRYSMIYVDADQPVERDGTVIAPVMSFEACVAKYAS